MSGVTIGDLSHRLRLEEPVRVADDGGGASESFAPIAEIWAAVRARAGSERLVADGLAGHATHEVWIRFRADVTPPQRFVEGDRILDIRAALDVDGRRRWLRCLCEERLS